MAKGEWKGTTEFIEKALSILKDEHPMTVRQLFYRLVSAGVIENTKDRYQYVSRMMTKARRDDRCPYEWLVDRSRPTYQPNAFENPAAYAEAVKRSYRKDYWAMQPAYCEIWCEKDAVIGSIEDTTDLLGVTLRVSRGFMSATRQNDIAQHFLKVEEADHSLLSRRSRSQRAFNRSDSGNSSQQKDVLHHERYYSTRLRQGVSQHPLQTRYARRIRDAATRHPQVGYQDVQPTAIESQGHRFSNRRLREEARRSLCRTRRSPANGVTESYRRRSQ